MWSVLLFTHAAFYIRKSYASTCLQQAHPQRSGLHTVPMLSAPTMEFRSAQFPTKSLLISNQVANGLTAQNAITNKKTISCCKSLTWYSQLEPATYLRFLIEEYRPLLAKNVRSAFGKMHKNSKTGGRSETSRVLPPAESCGQ